MNFEPDNKTEAVAQKVGYIFAYMLFTTILFIILNLLHKLPSAWGIIRVAAITLVIALSGYIVERLLR